jgi:CHAT domain-containing protein
LPTAFLSLGATGVLATFWPVDDISTALLISRFFQNHIEEDMRPAAALRATQLWLRDLTMKDLRSLVDEYHMIQPSEAWRNFIAILKEDGR